MSEQNKIWEGDTTLRVNTFKSGVFTFQTGFASSAINPFIDRVNDAQSRFNTIPGLPDIVATLEGEVLASSVYSTNTIEGGTFTEQETAEILSKDPETVQKTEEKRLTNLKAAIQWVRKQSGETFSPNTGKTIAFETLTTLHTLVCAGLDENDNPPGALRDNQPGQSTFVGDSTHGGRYRPPKTRADISYLLHAWLEWLNSAQIIAQPAIVRASLAHYYFERIHPFWDGNGRTGRLLEMLILEQAGYCYTASAVWAFYQERIHEYFTLFNMSRKAAEKKQANPNQAFVIFVLQGLFSTVNRLHDLSNDMISVLLYQFRLSEARNSRKITDRQYELMRRILMMKASCTQADLFRVRDIHLLYQGRTIRTYYRDIAKLISIGLLIETDNKIIANQ